MTYTAEVHGLAALMLYCGSRQKARRSQNGAYVSLTEQSVALWSSDLILEAEEHLTRAACLGSIGRFQLEAAIQSAHVSRITRGVTDWLTIVDLYRALLQFADTLGVRVGHAAAISEACGALEGVKYLETLPANQVVIYQPYWALVAHLHAKMGKIEKARQAYDRAIGLCEDGAVRQFLIEKSCGL